MHLILGLLIGGAIGAVTGYYGKCASGTCPLTSNPWIGGAYGALLGGLVAMSFAAPRPKSNTSSKENHQMTTASHAGILNLGDANTFDSVVLGADQPVLVDLWAPWCGPCRMQTPILEQLAGEVGDTARIVKINVDDHPSIASRLGVRGIPTLVVFRDGRESKRFVGVQSLEALKKALAL